MSHEHASEREWLAHAQLGMVEEQRAWPWVREGLSRRPHRELGQGACLGVASDGVAALDLALPREPGADRTLVRQSVSEGDRTACLLTTEWIDQQTD